MGPASNNNSNYDSASLVLPGLGNALSGMQSKNGNQSVKMMERGQGRNDIINKYKRDAEKYSNRQ